MKVSVPLLLSAVLLVGVASAVSPPRPPLPEPPGPSECEGVEGDRWRKDCNWCWCVNGGERCTRRLCPDGLPEGVADEEPECEGNPTWKNDCNTCHCSDSGTAICTSIHCEGPVGPVQTLTVERRAVQCEEGSRWREACNWCVCNNGQSSCTEAACTDWNEAVAEEEGIVQCHGESRWKKDCNWCNCVNGRGICTQRACIPPERDPFRNLPENAVCVPGSRWKEECNTCTCTETGVAACTLRACIPGFEPEGPTCDEGSIWRNDDCNLCRCNNGTQACSKRLCRGGPSRSPGAPQTRVSATPSLSPQPQPECEGEGEGNRWREECNWCSCGANGVSRCTRRLCQEGVPDEEPECEGTVSWKKECNRCHCVNGTAVCTLKLCGAVQARPVLLSASGEATREPECHGTSERDRWREQCNWCRCRNGVGACTKRLCPPGIPDDAPECEGDVSWTKDCNTCRCVNNRAVCTAKFCGHRPVPAQPVAVSRTSVTREAECEGEGEGNRWRQDCNWCRCRNGRSRCTRQLCPGDAPDDEPECEGTISWKKDCNWCHCSEGRGMCTTKFCGPLPARPFATRTRTGVREEAACEGEGEGNRWREECNWCRCSNGRARCTKRGCPDGVPDEEPECEGTVSWKKDCNTCHCVNGSAACTFKFCGPIHIMPRGEVRRQEEEPLCQGDPETDSWIKDCNTCRCRNGRPSCTKRLCRGDEQSPPKCEGNPTWKEDCNTCHCNNGTPVCTTKYCGPIRMMPRGGVRRQEEEPRCQGDPETDSWIKDCNTCRCRNGRPSCTKRLCRGGEQSPQKCEGNPTWKDDCNTCHCSNGRPICTSKNCGGPYGPVVTVQHVSIARSQEPVCVDGSRWRMDCNWCVCHDGQAACTLKGCLGPIDDQTPECEGNSTWKDDCNWCSCGNGIALCTKMACLKDFANLCAEGTSWKEDCNICRCTHGFAVCTQKACISRDSLQCQGDSCEPSELPELCKLPPVSGPLQCTGFFMKWTFSVTDGECKQIVYGGCAGTENLFDSQVECEAACPAPAPATRRISIQPVSNTGFSGGGRCTLPVEPGPCFAAFKRYAYNAGTGACQEFTFGGCAGNANNFHTEEECLAACQGTQETACDKSKCPWNHWGHYLAKECVPQYAGDACCPTSFQCPSASESGKDETKCYYKGVAYSIGDRVPVEEPCSASCRCSRAASIEGGPAEINCANVECPGLFRPPKPGCRQIYSADKCCPVDEDCVDPDSPPLEPRAATCAWGNKTYYEGDRMYFDDYPCRKCICEPGFTDPNGPGCFNIDCGLTFRYTSEYNRGCAPIRFEKDGCCPISWMCPDDSRIKSPPQQQASGADESAVCRLGDRQFAVGELMETSECNLECRCVTPPELTCIQYRTCELAQEVAAERECPALECGEGCRPVVADPGECPTCSCSSDTFTCPAQTCPSTCSAEVDLQTGCPSCKCQCPPEVPCPLDCAVHTVLDESTGCPRCECRPDSPQLRSNCPVYPGGRVPCPQDCAVIKRVDENGCEVCECDPSKTGTPFGPFGPPPPRPPQSRAGCRTMPDGRAPCPMDCAVRRFTDENGCEVCECDPDKPGNPFGPFGPPPPRPPQSRSVCRTMPDGRAPCPMDCAIRRFTDENDCEVCECDPTKPGTPFGPFRPPQPQA